MLHTRHIIIIVLAAFILATTSCRKSYYNCRCTYINEYDETDTTLLAVRAKSSKQAAKQCIDEPVRISLKNYYMSTLFCTLE